VCGVVPGGLEIPPRPKISFNKIITGISENLRFAEKLKSQMPDGTLKHIFGLAEVIPKNQVLRKSQKSKKNKCFGTIDHLIQ